jgi:hypothetical protein
VTTRIDRVLLMAGAEAPNSWRVLHQFTLSSTADQLTDTSMPHPDPQPADVGSVGRIGRR